MRRFLLTILEQAVGPNTVPLSVRIFRLVSFFTGVLCLFVYWPVNLFEPDVPGIANVVVIGLGLLALAILWQSRQGRHLVWVLLAAIIVAMDFVWFAKGGFRGEIPLFYPTLMALPLILYSNWRRWLAVGLIAANFCALWRLTVLFPNWVVRLNHPAEVNLDIAAGVFLNCLSLAIILTILMHNYHQERQGIAASEKKYRQLFENMTVGFALHELICDATGKPADYRFLAVNPAFEKLTGISAAAILGKTIREVRPDTEDYWIEVFGSVALTGVPRAYMNYSRELGRYYDTWSFQTGLGGFAVMFSDVTEKKLAEIKIQQQARLLDEARDAIAVIGLDGKFTYVNEAWAQMHGWKKAELIGQHLAAVHTPEQFQACEHINDDVARHGRVQTETGHKRQDGSTFPVWLSVSEVHDTDGRLTGFLGIANDLTSRKKMEAQLLRSERLQTIGTLASGVAHDLNNIFAPFLMGLPILREEIRARETRELLDLMESSIRRGADIVQQLLLFGRGGETKRLPVNLARPLGDVAKIIRETFPRDILLQVVCPDDLWFVLGDATQIYQIFLNLAVNARDAMPHGGTLAITAENARLDERIRTLSPRAEPGPYVVLTVRDTGVGMTPEVLARAFEPFYTTKETGKGTGLGLSVAIGVVENHGGFIHVQSTPNAGTEFKIHLPARPDAAVAAVAKKPEIDASPGSGECILLVDDEPSILKITAKILERSGYQSLVAPNGAEALKVFQQNEPRIRLVITDYSMPGMNGVTLAESLKKLNAGVPILLSSGLGDVLDAGKLCQAGIQTVLKKPYDTATLLKTLDKIFTAAPATKSDQ
jgi:PAS domain S-box-containing protein